MFVIQIGIDFSYIRILFWIVPMICLSGQGEALDAKWDIHLVK